MVAAESLEVADIRACAAAIVADGDGVVVAPRARTSNLAVHAQKVIERDKAGRCELSR